MFKAWNKAKKIVGGALLAVGIAATPVIAAIDPLDETAIKTGVANADVLFFSIGGSILVVLAGMWGFKRVKAMFGS